SKAEDLAAQIEAKIPSITITLAGAAENDSPVVAIDGVSVPPGSVGVARKIDPGHHVVTAKGSSGQAQEEIDLADGEKKDVELTLTAGGEGSGQEGTPAAEGAKNVVHSPGTVTYVAG